MQWPQLTPMVLIWRIPVDASSRLGASLYRKDWGFCRTGLGVGAAKAGVLCLHWPPLNCPPQPEYLTYSEAGWVSQNWIPPQQILTALRSLGESTPVLKSQLSNDGSQVTFPEPSFLPPPPGHLAPTTVLLIDLTVLPVDCELFRVLSLIFRSPMQSQFWAHPT